jgi:hypothetical protein
MIILVSAISAFSKARDSDLVGPETLAQNVFSLFFVRYFGPEPPGTFPGQRLWAPGTKESGPSLRTSKTQGVAQRRDGGGGFLAPAWRLRPKGRRLQRKWLAMANFVGRPIKVPFLPHCVCSYSFSLSSIVDFE